MSHSTRSRRAHGTATLYAHQRRHEGSTLPFADVVGLMLRDLEALERKETTLEANPRPPQLHPWPLVDAEVPQRRTVGAAVEQG